MLSKEEIENMKKYFNECILKDTTYEEDLTLNYIKIAREYIKQLETREQKLIKKLEETRNNLEKDGFIGYADEMQEVLEILKGEKE